MRILIVEDDHLQLTDLRDALRSHYPQAELIEIRTEQEFRGQIDEIAKNRPDIVILDLMIRWIRRGKAEAGKRGESPQTAGFRCARLLAERGVRVPIIFLTMLDKKDFESEIPQREGVVIVPKETSFDRVLGQIDKLIGVDASS